MTQRLPVADPSGPPFASRPFFRARFHSLSLEAVAAVAGQRDPAAPFAYVVTPNADHVVRLERAEEPVLRAYRMAWLSVCDSRVVRLLGWVLGERFFLVNGTDLAVELFRTVIGPGDTITVIGCDAAGIIRLRSLYPHLQINHFNPPMGFIQHEQQIEQCIKFVIENPARFVFLSVGAPQQELLAERIAASGRAVGIGLCLGAAIAFISGTKVRAPVWVQRAHLEWLHRLLSDPGRLWRRYLVDCPHLLGMVARAWVARRLRPHDRPVSP